MESEFKTKSPTAAKIIEKLEQNEKISQMIREALQVPFLPF